MKKIAVITPYFKESLETLRQCHQSVLDQNVDADHLFVADGFPKADLGEWSIKHVILPQAHADNGNTPRGIGSLLAEAEGYEFISYLDADNWFHSGHLSSLKSLWESTNSDVCCSFRTIHQLDGTEMTGIQDSDELSLRHVDTSCYLLHRRAFDCLSIWLKMPRQLSPICDRVFLSGLRHKNYRFAFSKKKTVAFRSQYKVHYLAAQIAPPKDAKEPAGKEAIAWLSTADGVRETVKRLGFFPL